MTLRNKIIGGKKLTAEEVKDIIYEDAYLYYEIIEEISNGHGRWVEYMTTIIELGNGDYYALDWDRGLTEYQDNEFEAQVAIPVKKKEIITYEWVAKK